MKNSELSAFAAVSPSCKQYDGHLQEGLTKREYFAGLAMLGILSSRGLQNALSMDGTPWEREAVRQADALLEELDKK